MKDILEMLLIPFIFALLALICEFVVGPGSAIYVLIIGVIIWLIWERVK
jgi:hypothetical protein